MAKLEYKPLPYTSTAKSEIDDIHPFSPMWRIKQVVEKINDKRKSDILESLRSPEPFEYVTVFAASLMAVSDSEMAYARDPRHFEFHETPMYSFGWQYFIEKSDENDEKIEWPKDYFDEPYAESDFIMVETSEGPQQTLRPGVPARAPIFNAYDKFHLFIQGYADSEMFKFTYELLGFFVDDDTLKSISKNNLTLSEIDMKFEQLKKKESIVKVAVPMAIITDYFRTELSRLNREGRPYLSTSEIIQFLTQAFIDREKFTKLTIDLASDEKTYVIQNIFFKFWDVARKQFNTSSNNKVFYKRLVEENFSNFEEVNDHTFRKPKGGFTHLAPKYNIDSYK